MKVLAIVAHPDDEVLGCGGILACHGSDAAVGIVVPRGQEHMDAADRAADVLGVRRPSTLTRRNFEDQRLDGYGSKDIISLIEDWLRETQPSVIYTHWRGDANADHVEVARAVTAAARPSASPCVRAIYACEIPSSTEWGDGFWPTCFSAIPHEAWERKERALACYSSELRPAPHPRSLERIRARAMVNGAVIMADYAEAFAVIRQRLMW